MMHSKQQNKVKDKMHTVVGQNIFDTQIGNIYLNKKILSTMKLISIPLVYSL